MQHQLIKTLRKRYFFLLYNKKWGHGSCICSIKFAISPREISSHQIVMKKCIQPYTDTGDIYLKRMISHRCTPGNPETRYTNSLLILKQSILFPDMLFQDDHTNQIHRNMSAKYIYIFPFVLSFSRSLTLAPVNRTTSPVISFPSCSQTGDLSFLRGRVYA